MIIDILDQVDKKILNNCWRFCKDSTELNDNCYFLYYTKDESDKLDYCCKDSLERGFNYCSECGEDLRYIDDYELGNINSKEFFPNEVFHTMEEFKELFIKYNDLEKDYFDEIDLYEDIVMSDKLYATTKIYLEQERLI